MSKNATKNGHSKKEKSLAKNRHTNVLMIVLSICGAVLVLSIVFWNVIGGYLREPGRVQVLKIGTESYTAAEFNFYYFGAYEELRAKSNGSENLMGLDPSKNLSEQPCTISDKEESWQDYFTEQATDALSRMSVAYCEAKKVGYTLTDGISTHISDVIAYYKDQSRSSGYSDFAAYLTNTYGKGMTEDVLRDLMTKTYIGKVYTDDMTSKYHFTDEELNAYYSKHAYEYSTYSYLYAFVGGGGQTNSSDICSRLISASSSEEFESLTRELTNSDCYTMKDISGSDLGKASASDVLWLADAHRKPGDTFIGQSGDNRYVLYFVSSNDNGFKSKSGDWISIAQSGLKNETFTSWENEMISKYHITVCSGMKYARSLN